MAIVDVACPSTQMACCQPVSLSEEHYAAHDARLQAARALSEASRPRACPRCSGDELVAVFDVDGAIYSCEDCGHYFDGEGER